MKNVTHFFTEKTMLLTLLLGVLMSFSNQTTAQGCAFEDAYDSQYVQGIINANTDYNETCFFTQQYILFEYEGEAYIRKIAGYNSFDPNTGIGCPGPDISDGFYDCEGNYICGFGFAPTPTEFCNALIAASSSGTVIWSVDGATTNVGIQTQGYYTYTACIGEILTIPINLSGAGLVLDAPPCINNGTFDLSEAVDANGMTTINGTVANGILTLEVSGSGVIQYNLNAEGSCNGFWNFTVDVEDCDEPEPPVTDCEIVDDPFALSFIQDVVDNPNQFCLYYTSISQINYNGASYFLLAANPTGDLSCSPDLGLTLRDCEGNLICDLSPSGISNGIPLGLCSDVLDNGTSTLIWENTNFPEECVVGDAFALPFVQEAINTEATTNAEGEVCWYISEIIQFTYNFNTYFRVNEVVLDGALCPTESGDKFYDCEGNYICGTGFYTPSCSGNTSVLDAGSADGFVIWSAPPLPGACNIDDPFDLSFIQDAVGAQYTNANGDICWYVSEILEIEYEGATYFAISEAANNLPLCASETGTKFYDCEGNYVCGNGFYPDSEGADFCDGLEGASGTVIWSSTPVGPLPGQPVTNPLFAEYPWIGTLVDQNECNGEVIIVYSSGGYDFIYIENAVGANLYFEDGTFYCGDLPNYSCVAAYGFTNVTTQWACGDTPEPPNPPNPTNDPVFINYSWLSSIVNQNNCNGESITIYTTGNYEFIYVQTNSVATLYFETGQFYCEDSPGYDCVAAYGLSTVASTWTCGSDGGDNGENTAPDFTDYPWLNNIVDANDCNANSEVIAYTSGIYTFIYVGGGDGFGTLYFQDGTLYCEDSPGYDCAGLYGLSSMASETLWTCGLDRQEATSELSEAFHPTVTERTDTEVVEETQSVNNDVHNIERLAQNTSFQLYPNPSSGRVFLNIENQSVNQTITVFDVRGKALQELMIDANDFNTTIEMDLTELPTGIYLVELKTPFNSSVKRLIIE